MPAATIKIVGGKPTPEQKKALFEKTTDLMVEILQRTKKLVVVSIEEDIAANWAVAGAQLPDGAVGAQVVFRILQGSNTEEQLSRMVAAMTKMVEEVLGPNALPAYVVFEQIATSAWGYGGKTIAEIQRARAQAQSQPQAG
jgi:4-oxalocrotonate tautomerase family enzyme